MKSITSCVMTMAVLAGTTLAVRAAAAPTVQAPPVALTIRFYNTSGMPSQNLLAARRATESILRDTGLDVVLRHCGRSAAPGEPVDACDEPLKASELVVRIIDAPAFNTTLHPDVYGLAYVVPDTNPSWNSTLPPGGSIYLGFNGTSRGTMSSPSSVTLNGTPCRAA